MSIPQDRKYSESHEWYRVEGNTVVLGITQFAADELTDITYVELPQEGAAIKAGAAVGEIESVKATSEVFTVVGGKVSAVNTALSDKPELINEDAFGDGWIVKIEAADLAPLEKLMDAAAYAKVLGA
ncbi:MAG TPA: glycine cleavage system protein GcvH [Phycisphaerae bacterium]|nr:glycine cleavage system protein GcvH [Phycisphaerae bacterium]